MVVHQQLYPTRTATTTMASSSGYKSVRFAREADLCRYQKGPRNLTFEMIRELWFQPEDFEGFKISARQSSDNAIKKGLSAYIKRTYGSTDGRTQEMLNLWTRCSDTRRGLERFINQEYAQKRVQVRQTTVRAVLYTQGRLCNEGVYQYSETSEVIRNVATGLTSDAITFASMLGKADFAAVTHRRATIMRRLSPPDAAASSSSSSSSRPRRTSWSPPSPPPLPVASEHSRTVTTTTSTNSRYEISIGSHRRHDGVNGDDGEDGCTIPVYHAKNNNKNSTRSTMISGRRQRHSTTSSSLLLSKDVQKQLELLDHRTSHHLEERRETISILAKKLKRNKNQ